MCAFVCSWLYVIQRLSYAAYVLFVGKSVVTTPPCRCFDGVWHCVRRFFFSKGNLCCCFGLLANVGWLEPPWQQHLWSRGMRATAFWCIGCFCTYQTRLYSSRVFWLNRKRTQTRTCTNTSVRAHTCCWLASCMSLQHTHIQHTQKHTLCTLDVDCGESVVASGCSILVHFWA